MTIRDLEIFIEVVRTKNMSGAAKNLNISQPTVSHAISQIENEYNVKLFDRISKKLYITDVGLRLYNSALVLLREFEDTIIFLHGSSKSHNINLGVSSNFGSNLLLEIVNEFEEKNKEASVRVYVDSRENLLNKIKSGEMSLAIVEGEAGIEKTTSIPFFKDKLVVISNENYSFGDKKCLNAEDLKDRTFIMGEFDENSKKIFLNYLKGKNISIDLKYICQNNDMVLNIIKNSDTISLGSRYFLRDKNLKMHEFCDLEIERNFNIIYHNDQILKKDIKSFIDFIEEKFNDESIGS
ncbi:DNA-binding transcriptional LysR family regulator [Peptoniphilus olsenii]|uniref:DNA-binding transcriptional LysR family regulator n=1 Tax=Peptoniphilus olsenii TaxID=411570 RepID=A0ABV2JA00_9FIRM